MSPSESKTKTILPKIYSTVPNGHGAQWYPVNQF